MEISTHRKIDRELCGTPEDVGEGYAVVTLAATERMAADGSGLVHGGFLFGLADYAAMLAVNHPNVVLGAADVKFLKPVKTGESVTARAEVESSAGRKRVVTAEATRGGDTVLTGVFTCFVLDAHVLG